MQRSAIIRLIKILFLIIITLSIVVYAFFRIKNYAKGPDIEIDSPANGSSISSSTTVISGKAMRVNRISINGKSISIDEDGNFSEYIVVFPGINFVTVYAEDQFGRSIKEDIEIVGTRLR